MIVQSIAALITTGNSATAPTIKIRNNRPRSRRRPIGRAIEDRSTSIQKLQQQDYLPQPTEKAVLRHRERRRDIWRAKNLAAMKRGD